MMKISHRLKPVPPAAEGGTDFSFCPNERSMKRLLTLAMTVFLVSAPAQNRLNFPLSAQDSGHVALGLALRKLNVSGTFLQTAAHPDDETQRALRDVHARHGLAVDRRADQRAARAGRMKSGRSCSAISASCAPRSCCRRIVLMARSSTLLAPSTTAIRSIRRK